MRVAHITSVYEGGVSRAIETIVRIAPEHEHILLADGSDLHNGKASFEHVQRLPTGVVQRIQATRRLIESHQPDLVHAHSSWAGLYTRALPLRVPVLYQPHCFVMEDPARSRLSRGLYHLGEHLLSMRTESTVVLSNHEASLARRLLGHRFFKHKRIVHFPNAPSKIEGERPRRSRPMSRVAGPSTILMVGRICPQKDPEFYLRVVNEIRKDSDDVLFRWVGDGDPALRKGLEREGVHVTGWLDGVELSSELERADLYLHTARYEGFPLSVLDAANYEIPVVARTLPCFSGTGIAKATTAEELARIALSILTDCNVKRDAVKAGAVLLQSMSEQTQKTALQTLYCDKREVIS